MGQGSIIGYEINEKTCQISYYSEEQMENHRHSKSMKIIFRSR